MIYVFLGLLVVVLLVVRQRLQQGARARVLAEYRFPSALARKLRETYPHLQDKQVWQVLQGLREFFALTQMAQGRMVAMPSQAVDVAWHEFILNTRAYQAFCREALGRFLHHTPAEAMKTPTQAQDGIKRAWRLSCAREKIDPRHPAMLPLLFGLDAALEIPDGFRYRLDCTAALAGAAAVAGSDGAAGGNAFCASHIGCGGGCGGSAGSEAGDSGGHGHGDAGGHGDGGGHGCGGDGGCGGGCGGGD